jgi:hypothetical protein
MLPEPDNDTFFSESEHTYTSSHTVLEQQQQQSQQQQQKLFVRFWGAPFLPPASDKP